MKSLFSILSLVFFSFGLTAQNTVSLHCKIVDCTNGSPISVYEPAGLTSRLLMQGEIQEDGNTIITLPAGEPKLYLIGPNQASVVPIILGEEPNVTLWGTCSRFQYSRTSGSPINKALESTKKRIEKLNKEGQQWGQDYAATLKSGVKGSALGKAEKGLEMNNTAKNDFVDSLKKVQPLLARYAGLFLHPEHKGDGTRNPKSFDFVAKNFFQYADLTDKKLEEMPQITEAFGKYASALSAASGKKEQVKAAIMNQMGAISEESPLYRMALGGIVSGLKTANSPLFFDFGKMYVEKYKSNDLADIRPLEREMNRAKSFMTGIEAPNLEGQTPEGGTYSLKEMRGKYVLVDFWASWCGPCRKENPNVKRVYEKYKDKGFDILGVSLDRDKNRWVQAIEKDGLPWAHISDLGGWKSQHAALYGITSIPHTVLLDKEGNIVVRNLRGPALEKKLAELFGE